MRIIGITGAIGHGKSSLAEAFLKAEPSSTHLESFHVIAEVANRLMRSGQPLPQQNDLNGINNWLADLPAILQEVLHLETLPPPIRLSAEDFKSQSVEYIKLFQTIANFSAQPELLEENITTANKVNYRPILQWLGGYVTTRVAPGGWYNELVRRARQANKKLAIIGGVRFPGDGQIIQQAGGIVVHVVRPGMAEADIEDPTERERSNVSYDVTVVNDGSLADLERLAAQLWRDVQASQPQPVYKASSLSHNLGL